MPNDLADNDPIWDTYLQARIVDHGAAPGDERARNDANAAPCHIITACNPRSERFPEPTNIERNAQLERELQHNEHRYERVDGVSLDGEWREPAFLVYGLDRQQAAAIGDRFEQNAIFELEGRALRIVADNGRVMRERRYPLKANESAV